MLLQVITTVGMGTERCTSPGTSFYAWGLQVDSETEFRVQMQQECNTRGSADKRMERAVHDGAVPWTNSACRLVVPNSLGGKGNSQI